jgi:hypothetical protein
MLSVWVKQDVARAHRAKPSMTSVWGIFESHLIPKYE